MKLFIYKGDTMSKIPIIGQDEQVFALVYNKNVPFRYDTFEKCVRWLMIALPNKDLIGVVPCVPAILGLWDANTQADVRGGGYFPLTRADLITPEELGIEIVLNPPAPIENILPENEILFGGDEEIV